MTREQILSEIDVERDRQDAKWGEQTHSWPEWMTILLEEVGEASREAVELHFNAPGTIGEHIDKLTALRTELVQTAAVAVHMIEKIDHTEIATPDTSRDRYSVRELMIGAWAVVMPDGVTVHSRYVERANAEQHARELNDELDTERETTPEPGPLVPLITQLVDDTLPGLDLRIGRNDGEWFVAQQYVGLDESTPTGITGNASTLHDALINAIAMRERQS